MTEQRITDFLNGLIDPVKCEYGTLFKRDFGRYKGKWRAVSNKNHRHIKGVFDTPIEAFEALRVHTERKQ